MGMQESFLTGVTFADTNFIALGEAGAIATSFSNLTPVLL